MYSVPEKDQHHFPEVNYFKHNQMKGDENCSIRSRMYSSTKPYNSWHLYPPTTTLGMFTVWVVKNEADNSTWPQLQIF